MSLRSVPTITAQMHESPLYNIMGGGLTDRLFLLGHADGLELNVPYQVMSMNAALNKMQSDVESPLVKGLLEAFLAGARDVWIVAVAPMDEYEPELENRDPFYYATYKDRLDVTYEVIKEWDIPQIIVPLEAPFNSGSDFLTPLVELCVDIFNISGQVPQGLLGTRGDINEDYAATMASDGRLTAMGEAGKFVSVFVGDVIYNFKMLPVVHTSSAVACIAGQLSALPLNSSIINKPLKNAANPAGIDLPQESISQLAEAGLNYVGRRRRGRRGEPFQVAAFTDNTLAEEGSDYWSMLQVKLVSRVVSEIKAMGHQRIGRVGFGKFKSDVERYLLNLTTSDQIRGYHLDVYRSAQDPHTAFVDLSLSPYFGVREIDVSILVGPDEGGTRL